MANGASAVGKFSDFPRRARDCYDTPPEAVLPLIGHLPPGVRYWEPCAGAGRLIEALRPRATCVQATDIAPRNDRVNCLPVEDVCAEACGLATVQMFITNPPWPAPGRHGEPVVGIVRHLAAIRPTWLLLPLSMAAARYFAGIAPICAKIVIVGRVSWMENGTSGKEDCAWYLFDARHIGQTRFFPKQTNPGAAGSPRSSLDCPGVAPTAPGAFTGGAAPCP